MHISYFPFPIVHSKCLCLCAQPDSSQKRMLMVLWAHVSDNRYFRLKHTHAEQSNILWCIYKSDVPRFQLSGTEFQTLIQKLSLCSDIVILCAYVLLSHVWFFCDPMDYSLPGSSVHGISQVRILEWVDMSFSRGPSQPKLGSPALQALSSIGTYSLPLNHQGSPLSTRSLTHKRIEYSV